MSRQEDWVGETLCTQICVTGRKLTVALALLLATGCGSDSFVAQPGDAASQVPPGSEEAGADASNSVVSICIDLCKSQVAGGCHSQLTTPDLCGLICSVFNQLDEECREASRIAFECQLNADPCSTTGCNDLLKEAETQCPEIPDL